MAPHPGGGGLVILPHKSWNVWNQDNKAKVAADEQANAQLIAAKEQCRKEILQQIRFERLNGQQISQEQEEERIQHALDTININDYIKDNTMRDIAKNINDKLIREEMKSNTNHKRKFKHINNNLSEEQIKYGPRKRHKRNDVLIIEDHYNNKTQFEFDPMQYNTVNDRNNNSNNNKNNKNTNRHFSLFNESDLQSKYNENGYKNQQRILEEKQAKEREDMKYKLGKTEIEHRKHKKPWYLMTNKREMDRRMLMKSDEIQYSLPSKFKDYNKNTKELKSKVITRQNKDDPMNVMNKYIKKQKEMNMVEVESVCTERDNREFYEALKRRRDRKKKKEKKKRRKERYNEGNYESENRKRSKKKKKVKKSKKHSHRR